MSIIECVPNFSEGRSADFLRKLSEAVENVAGARLLNLEPDADYHRSVCTFAGEPQAVVEAALAASKTALENIDMRKHRGGHPRMGAVDVVPFVPVKDATMNVCIACAKQYAERAASELGMTLYLYGEAASRPERRNLAAVRKGQYEGMAQKVHDPLWKPDFGPVDFDPRFGVTATGARKFLIAYNVNLATQDLDIANEIAFQLRESGHIQEDADGNRTRVPGKLKAVKALGVALEQQGFTQVSMNLVDYDITNVYVAFEAVKEEAHARGVEVTGSEAIGLVPAEALVRTGRFYEEKDGISLQDDRARIDLAVEKLGLNDFNPFDPLEKVVELKLAQGK